MSLLRRAGRAAAPAPERRALPLEMSVAAAFRRGGVASALMSVSPESARRQSTFWAGSRLYADLIRQLPVDSFSRRGGVQKPIDPPQWYRTPMAGVRWSSWVDMAIMSLLYRGNLVGYCDMDQRTLYPSSITLLDPDRVTRKGADWSYNGKPLDPSRVWWTPWALDPADPMWGISPLQVAARSLGVADAARAYVESFFKAGGHPTLEVIYDDPDFGDDDAAKAKSRVMDVMSGDREPWVHGSGITTKVWQLSPVDAAFLEVANATDVDVCRFLGIRSPEMVGVAQQGSSITYANLEQRMSALLQFTLGPVIRLLEEAMSDVLVSPSSQFLKFNVGLFLRGDAMTQAKIEDMRVRNGTQSRDDVRKLHDEDPIPDGTGGEYLWPPGATTLPDAPTPDPLKEGGNAA